MPVDSVILRKLLADLGYPMDENTLNSYLAYLSERGYVRVEDRKKYEIVLVTITADGLDVLDCRIDDRGVGVKI
jgi:predicted transport protein